MQSMSDRLGLKTAIRRLLEKPLPDRVGWPHVLGSMLLALFAMQLVTGILLSFVYSPSPLSAYLSIRYVMDEMQGGAWLRGIHYWAASLMVIVAALHVIRTFLYAAYRSPRQITWIVGVLLLLCTLSFAQTGYLLPWDQKAYWGTAVTIEIIESVPWIGPKFAYFLRAGQTVGALTLNRFFSTHAIILPLITILLVAIHLTLVVRFGITAPGTRTGEEPPGRIPFYPYQMAKDAAAMFFILAVALLAAWLLPAPLGFPADTTDTTYVPRPDWYFLFLFQLLYYFEGKWEIVGTFVLPGLAMGLLFLIPFLDRNPSRRLRSRPIALAGLVLSVCLWAYLTHAAVQRTPKPPAWQRPPGISVARPERVKRPSEVGGLYVLKQYCFECHSMTVLGERSNLQTLARNRFPAGGDWLQTHLQKQGRTVSLNEKEVGELLSGLRVVTGEHPETLFTIPVKARLGAHLFYNKACFRCHKIDGQGGEQLEAKAPDLTVRQLRTKAWHMQHIHDPRSLVPNSEMPPFLHYEQYEYEALAEYILYLHTP